MSAASQPESLAVKLAGWSIADFTALSLSAARPAVDTILAALTPRQKEVAARPLGEISERIDFLLAVGLGYLSLERSAATLSGGEAQRIRLATQIGSRLRGVLYVLDEPSIGLHARDNDQLLHSLEQLRNLGTRFWLSNTMKIRSVAPIMWWTLDPEQAMPAAIWSPAENPKRSQRAGNR